MSLEKPQAEAEAVQPYGNLPNYYINNERKEWMSNILKPLFVVLFTAAIIWLMSSTLSSNIDFEKNVYGWMDAKSAYKLGLIEDDGEQPFSPKRVWLAKYKDGYEYRAVYPIIGPVPFAILGSGRITKDLLADCEKLGGTCHRLNSY